MTHAHCPVAGSHARPPRRDRCADPSVCVFLCLVCLFGVFVCAARSRRRAPTRAAVSSAAAAPLCARSCMRTRIIIYEHTQLRAALRRPAAHVALRSAADGADRSHGIPFAVIRRDACLPRYSRRAVRSCSAPVYLKIARRADGPAPWRARPAGARAPRRKRARGPPGGVGTHTHTHTHGGSNQNDMSILINIGMSICLCI
jgi:hypothetical protein